MQAYSRYFRRLWMSLALWLALPVSAPLISAEPVSAEPGSPQDRLEQAVLKHSLYRDADVVRKFQRGIAAQEQGELLRALTLYQGILAGGSDSVFWATDTALRAGSSVNPLAASSSSFRSVRQEVRRRLEKLIEAEPDLYERTQERMAQSLLKEARETGSQALFEEVVRRFFETRAGFRAVDQLATQYLDQNSPEQAARLLQRLVKSSVHRSRITRSVIVKAGCALQLCGNHDAAQQLLVDAQRSGVAAAQLAGADEAIAKATAAFQRENPPDEWRTPYGSVSHNGAGIGTVPWLKPVWSQGLAGNDPFAALVAWERDQVSDELKAIGTVSTSLIVNGQLVLRDFNGIRSVDPRSGKLLWRYDSAMSVPRTGRAMQTAFYASEDNRVAELAWFGNSMLGQLTSDGERVFGVDLLSFVAVTVNPGVRSRSQGEIEARNQLVALRIPNTTNESNDHVEPARPEIAWRAGGSPGPSPADPLAGHLFLGPPLPVGGVVFAVTESQRELCLVKLDAATGRVIWIQRFGLVEQPLFDDEQIHRAMAPYLPAFADGLVICPTGSGLVVAIDALFGEIAWAAHCGDFTTSGFRGSSTTVAKRPLGLPGFPGPPTAHRGSVVYLPRVSSKLFCFDLATGNRVWKVPRQDALYVGSVTDHGVLVVGLNKLRLLSLLDGHEIWTKGIPIPSGRGVRSGDTFMLPLKSGAVTVVDLATGKMVSQAEQLDETIRPESDSGRLPDRDRMDLAEFGLSSLHVSSNARPGNLLLHNGLVISTGPRHVTAFRQAESLMQELYSRVTTGNDVEAEVLAAQLELSTGRIDQAEKRLTELLKRGGISQNEPARRLLYRLLVKQLNDAPNPLTESQRGQLLETVDGLAKSDDEKWQAFIERTRLDVDRKDWPGAWQAASRMTASDFSSFVQPDSRSETVVRTDVWGQSLLARMQTQQDASQLKLHELRALNLSRQADTASQRKFLRLYAETKLAGRVRNRLADRLNQQGSYQEAELLLIDNRAKSTGESRAVATLLLICLWDQLGLYGESGIALAEFAREFVDLSLPSIHEDSLTSLTKREGVRTAILRRDSAPLDGRAMLASFGETSPTRGVFDDLQPLPWDVTRVSVRKFSLDATRPEFGATWSSGRVLSIGKRNGFDLIRRGNLSNTNWVLVDRFGGNERGSIVMPGRTSLSVSPQNRMIGHFMPVGSPAEMTGVSLLEFEGQAPLWNHRFPRIPSDKLIDAGPATPSVCVFQTKKHLIGIHPGTGRILWRKSDLEPDCGLYVDREAGLFGDDEVLILFHADQKSWTKLSTRTGETLATGTLEIELRYMKFVFGRKLLHVSATRTPGDDTRKRIRIWDAKTNQFDFDEPIEGRYFATRTPDNRLFALLTFESRKNPDDPEGPPLVDRRLRIFQMPDATIVTNVMLTPEQVEGISNLLIFADSETLFVNTQRTVNLTAQTKYHYLASDSILPSIPVQQGTLIAIDRKTGREIWHQHCRARTFLQLDRSDLPFLVSLSRVRPRNRTNIHGIELEAIDRRTGEILGSHRRLIPDRFVHTRMDRENGILQLYGLTSRVDIDFSRKTQRLLLERQPL